MSIFSNSFVEKIIFDGKKAIGIEVKIKNKIEKVYAQKELILSGGSINSPQLLMISGIGDTDHLKEKGISVVHDSKGVGKNLQDHLETYIMHECKTPDTLYTYTKLIPKVLAGIQWFLSKSGPCSQSYLEAGGFAKSSPEREIANIQFHFFPSFVIDHGLVNPTSHGYQLHASPNHPKSRGLVTLNSSDPYDYPKILFNYLKDEDDLKQTRECVHIARKILSQPSLAKHAGKEIGPGSNRQNDDELNEYIRSNAETAYHPCGTCKMGVDEMAVIEFARNTLKIKKAGSSELDKKCFPVIGLLNEWNKNGKLIKGTNKSLGGTMRLGLYEAKLRHNSLIEKIYKSKSIFERHRHRYEVNNNLQHKFEEKGMIFSGMSPDNKLPEIIELKNHPWFIGVQFHPEFKSRPLNPHPLFSSFIKAAKLY